MPHQRARTSDEPSRRLTLEEWAALPEDESGELCHGELVEEEVPDYVHEVVVAWLIRAFGAWVAPQGGLVGGSEAKFGVGAGHGRKADVTVYLPASAKPPRRGLVRIPPDIAVEVISPEPRDVRRDRVDKMEEYAAFGVGYYWIVDPEARTLEVFELGGDHRYTRALGATDALLGDIPGCPGLSLDLAQLWAETDRLGKDDRPASD
jgi:Uma2 family endonuclease